MLTMEACHEPADLGADLTRERLGVRVDQCHVEPGPACRGGDLRTEKAGSDHRDPGACRERLAQSDRVVQ